ncbi:prepilin-type N-terminal cleavage/methylation domain-containing protein [Alteromonadaceae bacterium 2753L.S.0a.02]|nr:prepilin-type N-terminal cleavage/methylation domain-containing protein [Alteromonadaceae bacterium 2753L.S.0a.02]
MNKNWTCPYLSKKQQGFTLVELMVSLALGVIISGAAVTMYVESKRSYMQDEEMARLQENARFALDYLKREISLSGFFAGINDTSELFAATVTTDCDNSGTDWALDLNNPLEIINNATTGSALVSLIGTEFNCIDTSEIVDTTDLIAIKRTSDAPTLENGSLINTATTNQWYLKKFDYTTYSWSYLTGAIPSAEQTAGSTFDYWQFYTNIFYIRDYSITAGDNIPTLCTASLVESNMTSRCLIEGIEDIQIELGIDNDDDGVVDQYKATPTAADFQNAKAVRLYLLARSINPVGGYTNDKAYRLGVKQVAAFGDRYMRKVFSTTVKLRNTKLG